MKYILSCYDVDLNNAENVNSGTNKVFKIRKDGENFYLRISMRGFDYVSAEIDWIEYLKNEIRVPEPVISLNGRLVEKFQENNQEYAICIFRELPGVKWKKSVPCAFNEQTYFFWGKTMGRMHHITKNYRPSEKMRLRPRFEESYNPLSNYRAVPLVQEKMAHIQSEISALPQNADSYGLIHFDMQQQNFLINGNEISVLDFDECQYGFFALDIGVALYHAIWWDLPDDGSDKNAFALGIIKNFMRGYNTENSLCDFWLKKIVLFMQYRQIQALSWHIGVYKSNGFTAVVYNELFGIYFDFERYIKCIESGVLFEGCKITENDFINIT